MRNLTTEPEYRKQVDIWVDAHVDQMLEDLKTLVRIPSVRGEKKEGMPYGEMPAKAIGAMQELMERYGLRTTNYENHCVAGDLDGEGEKTLDILAHLDVVPVSENWTKTDPFEPLLEDGRIYGRGTSDDKGPAIAALYAVRCVRELGLSLKHGVRLICGSDEECGSNDLMYYFSREKEALYTFSPDADYPLINIEKGRLEKEFRASGPAAARSAAEKQECVRVKRIRVGSASNIVPGEGTIVLENVSEDMLRQAARMTERTIGEDQKAGPGTNISWVKRGEEYAVTVVGKTAHAAHPADGINSVTLILEFVKHLGGHVSPGEDMLLRIGALWPHGDFSGESLGISNSDEESGDLTMTLNILDYTIRDDSFEIKATFDCRAPLCCNDSNLTEKVRRKLEEAGFEMEEGGMQPGHYVSAKSELVKRLLESYELYFEKKGIPIAIGGGTYVHNLERGVAFGCADPGVDNRMHGDDEFMEIPMLVKSTKVFADAIMRLCGRENS